MESYMETFVKIDPEKHMYRWYSIGIQSTLVDDIAVIYGWGSLKSTFQQWRTIKVNSEAAAKELIARLLKQRIEKGYTPRK